MSSSVEPQGDRDRRKRKRLLVDDELDGTPARENSLRLVTQSLLSNPSKSEGAGSSKEIHMAGSVRQSTGGNRAHRLASRLFADELVDRLASSSRVVPTKPRN